MRKRLTQKLVKISLILAILIAYTAILYFAFAYFNNPSSNSSHNNADNSNNPNDQPLPNNPDIPDNNAPDFIEKEPTDPATAVSQPTTWTEIVRGDTTKKQVIFTFDAGSGNQSINKILTTLEKYNIKGTFFLTGKWASQNKEMTKTIASRGYEIFNHTYNHPDLVKSTDSEIIAEFKSTESSILELTGNSSKPFFRPPYGSRNTHVLDIAKQQGYRSVYWTVDALDWKESTGTTADQVKSRIYANLAPGTIYLMHVGDNITGNILDEVFAYIESRGYKIVSLTEGL